MSSEEYRKICMKACAAVEETASYIHSQMMLLSEGSVESKGLHDYVTYVDKTAEKMLIERLDKLVHGAGYIVEEESVEKGSQEYRWIIDPLDGTTNFIHRLPLYSISVALYQGDDARIGIIYEVNQKECFYTWSGGPAMLNSKIIHVSRSSDLNSCLLATGFPYTDYGRLDGFMEMLKWSMQNTRGLRRLGSAAVDLAWVACGRFDGFFEYGLQAWDVAAGAFLVKQAGGVNSDFNGNNNYLFGKEIIACNKNIYEELYKNVNSFLAIK